jgi:hypothetical protein
MPPSPAAGWQCRGPVATGDDQQGDGIRLDDGTWVDVGPDGRWRPSAGERARAAVILGVAVAALLLLALVVSGGGGDDEPVEVADDGSATTEPESTTTTEEVLEPSSVGGEAPSPECVGDDRDGAPLRERDEVVVLVLNATPRAGHAGAVSELLEALDYQVAVPDNGGRREVTSAGYLAGHCAEAERVLEDLGLPEATVEPVPQDLLAMVGRARIVVRLGADSL